MNGAGTGVAARSFRGIASGIHAEHTEPPSDSTSGSGAPADAGASVPSGRASP